MNYEYFLTQPIGVKKTNELSRITIVKYRKPSLSTINRLKDAIKNNKILITHYVEQELPMLIFEGIIDVEDIKKIHYHRGDISLVELENSKIVSTIQFNFHKINSIEEIKKIFVTAKNEIRKYGFAFDSLDEIQNLIDYDMYKSYHYKNGNLSDIIYEPYETRIYSTFDCPKSTKVKNIKMVDVYRNSISLILKYQYPKEIKNIAQRLLKNVTKHKDYSIKGIVNKFLPVKLISDDLGNYVKPKTKYSDDLIRLLVDKPLNDTYVTVTEFGDLLFISNRDETITLSLDTVENPFTNYTKELTSYNLNQLLKKEQLTKNTIFTFSDSAIIINTNFVGRNKVGELNIEHDNVDMVLVEGNTFSQLFRTTTRKPKLNHMIKYFDVPIDEFFTPPTYDIEEMTAFTQFCNKTLEVLPFMRRLPFIMYVNHKIKL